MSAMSNSAHETQTVLSGLTRAWQFLSGETRLFECSVAPTDRPNFAEFSFFMSLTLHDTGKRGGVAVMIQREDATRVATHMFGIERQHIHEGELRDACAEVGNVCANCISEHFSGGQQVSIGLPHSVNAQDYRHIVETSSVRAIYRSCVGTPPSTLVLFDRLSALAHYRLDS